MRILVLTDLYPPHFVGGYELQCERQASELTNRGHELAVLTSRWKVGKGTVEGNVYRLLHFDPVHLGLRSRRSVRDPLRLARRCHQVKWAFSCRRNYHITRKIAATLNPEIVYIWHLGGVSISPALAAQDQGVPTVFNLGDYWLAQVRTELCLEPNPMKRRYRAGIVGLRDFGRIDLENMLVSSRSLMRSYVELGFPERNITVIPRGVPSRLILEMRDLPSPARSSEDEVKLLFVGRLVPEKGPDVAIQALAHLAREMDFPRVVLDIVGAGPDKYVEQLQSMVTTWGLEERVAFVGRMDHQQLIGRYTEYNALLFTSRWAEPFGGTVLEAMARGLPVVATDRGGVTDIISDGEDGLLVPPDDPKALAHAVKRIVQSPALAQTIRHAALSTVRENYTHERIVDQTEQYLRTVLREAHQPSASAD